MAEWLNQQLNNLASPIVELGRDGLAKTLNRHFGLVDMEKKCNLRVKFILFFAGNDLNRSSSGEFFDKERDELKSQIIFRFSRRKLEGNISGEKMESCTRRIYAKLSRGLLEFAIKSKDLELAQSYKGIAWSVLTKDADEILSKNSIYIVSPKWKSYLWKMINVHQPDIVKINAELDKFTQKDASVFQPS